MPRVALATASTWPDLDADSALLVPALAELGIEAAPAVWDDPAVDWAAHDLVVVRSTWDYVPRRDAFLAWAGSVPRLHNPADVLTWNTDKTYLRDLAAAGVPVVPTEYVAPGEPYVPPAGAVVVKPTVSASAQDTERYDDARDGAALVARLHAQGRTAMVQPYLDAVDVAGETALLHFAGSFSHAVRKGPLLLPGEGVRQDRMGREDLRAVVPRPDQLEVAAAALAAVPAALGQELPLLYARVDVVDGPDGTPLLLELELVEPSLFLPHDDRAAARFAAAVRTAAVSPPRRPAPR